MIGFMTSIKELREAVKRQEKIIKHYEENETEWIKNDLRKQLETEQAKREEAEESLVDVKRSSMLKELALFGVFFLTIFVIGWMK